MSTLVEKLSMLEVSNTEMEYKPYKDESEMRNPLFNFYL